MKEEKPRALAADLVIPVVALAFTVYFFYSTRELGWEARANGLIVGALLIVLGLVQIGRVAVDYVRKRGTFSFGPLIEPRDIFHKRLGLLAITILFVATLPWLGLGIGLFAALAASFALMGVRPYARVLKVSAIITVVCWIGFVVVLDIGLPQGPLEKLYSHFRGD
ncbi:MAG TPA: tripartite tricarboxylate transporter TctB family protein [Usitatibacter sp.]|nr:tripartite tricarboxylate transporter TctB family protein [Usitatibacter sp.]